MGGEDITCLTFSLPLDMRGQCSFQSGETRFPARALRNVGSSGSPVNHVWTKPEILGKGISQTDVQAQLFYMADK